MHLQQGKPVAQPLSSGTEGATAQATSIAQSQPRRAAAASYAVQLVVA